MAENLVEKKKVKICIVLGEVVHVDVKTERKTFKVPSTTEIETSVQFEVEEEVWDKLAKFFYDASIYTWPVGYWTKKVRRSSKDPD